VKAISNFRFEIQRKARTKGPRLKPKASREPRFARPKAKAAAATEGERLLNI